MTEIVEDGDGERLKAESQNDSTEEEKDRRRNLIRGGI